MYSEGLKLRQAEDRSLQRDVAGPSDASLIAAVLESRAAKLKPLPQTEQEGNAGLCCKTREASQDASRAKEYRAAAFCMHSRGGKVKTPARVRSAVSSVPG